MHPLSPARVLRGLMPLCLVGAVAAAEVLPEGVEDPFGLGPRLALIDHLKERYGIDAPMGITYEELLERYNAAVAESRAELNEEEHLAADRLRRLRESVRAAIGAEPPADADLETLRALLAGAGAGGHPAAGDVPWSPRRFDQRPAQERFCVQVLSQRLHPAMTEAIARNARDTDGDGQGEPLPLEDLVAWQQGRGSKVMLPASFSRGQASLDGYRYALVVATGPATAAGSWLCLAIPEGEGSLLQEFCLTADGRVLERAARVDRAAVAAWTDCWTTTPEGRPVPVQGWLRVRVGGDGRGPVALGSAPLVGPAAHGGGATWPPTRGSALPEVTLLDADGRSVALRSFVGKPIILVCVAMSCSGSQALAGGNEIGGLGKVVPQGGIAPLDAWLSQVGQVHPTDPGLTVIHLLHTGFGLDLPTQDEAKSWEQHFGLDRRANHHVLIADSQVISGIQRGLVLCDERGFVVAEWLDPAYADDLQTRFMPALARLLGR